MDNNNANRFTKSKKGQKVSPFDITILKVLEVCLEKLNSLGQEEYLWDITKLVDILPPPPVEYTRENIDHSMVLVDFDTVYKDFLAEVEIFGCFTNLAPLFKESFLTYPKLIKWVCSVLLTLQERKEIAGEFLVRVISPTSDRILPFEEFIEKNIVRVEEGKNFELFYSSNRSTERELQQIKDFIGQMHEGVSVHLQRIVEKTNVEQIRCERILRELTTAADAAGEYLELEGVFIKSARTMEALEHLIADVSFSPFYCQLCGERHLATVSRMQCRNCGRYVCHSSYEQMAQVGRTTCPMCEGGLTKVN